MRWLIGGVVAFIVIRPQLHAIWHAGPGNAVWRQEAPTALFLLIVAGVCLAVRNRSK